MHIRPLKPIDIPTVASVSVDCLWDDELYDYTNPHKAQYPDHFRAFFVRRLHTRYWTPGFVLYVAVTDEDDEGHEEGGLIVGYAAWYRSGTSKEALKWRKWSVQSYIERALLFVEDAYIDYTHSDKSCSRSNLAKWLAASHDEFASLSELWKLQNLCVCPKFQRRGIGGMLITWGKQHAEREGCPVGLSSSMKGKGLYEKHGFRRYGTIRVEGFPIGDVPIFLWEPRGLEFEWGSAGDIKMLKEISAVQKE